MPLKPIMILALLALLSLTTKAQRYYGISHSNYAGVNGVFLNPANISDNRLKFDIQLGSFNILLNQSYGKASIIDNFDKIDFAYSNKPKFAEADFIAEARLPSFMFQLNKKSGLGFSIRARAMGSVRRVSKNLLSTLNDGFNSDIQPGNGTTIDAGKGSLDFQLISDIGTTYGRELYNTGNHFIKGGITFKVYTSSGFSGMRYDNFSMTLLDTSSSSKTAFIDGTLRASTTVSNANQFDDFKFMDLFNNTVGSGIGVDLGAVYELRESPVSDERYENKYKLKLGLSITDLGFINYKASNLNRNYLLNTNGSQLFKRYDTANFDLEDPLRSFRGVPGVTTNENSGKVKTSAPLAINVYADYKISKHVYINGAVLSGLLGNKKFGIRQALQFMITPRFESMFFDAGLPLSYNNLSKNVKLGLGLRLGFLFLGSDDLKFLLNKKNFVGANFYTGFRVGIPYKPKKERREKVEEATAEPATPSLTKDTDNDGVIDSEDKCVTVPGKKEFMGCPDTDSDGIEDREDKCPTVAGKKEFNGCPDTDNDGIPDSEDKCPYVAGKKELYGCVDTDGDGLIDSEDECPTLAGAQALKGCPDTDGDGVADKDDKCVDKAGPMDNAGCPKITEQVKKRLSFAAQNIQFEVNKAIIKRTSFGRLEEVVKILKEYNDYNLIIEGHTDNTGKPEKNQTLSEQRAQSVKNYFIKKGIEENRLSSIGYGDTKPLAPNTNSANKAKNRRVILDLKLKE